MKIRKYYYNRYLNYFKMWHYTDVVVIIIRYVFGITIIVHFFIVSAKECLFILLSIIIVKSEVLVAITHSVQAIFLTTRQCEQVLNISKNS